MGLTQPYLKGLIMTREQLEFLFIKYLQKDDVVQLTSYSIDLIARALWLIPKAKLRKLLKEHEKRYEKEDWFKKGPDSEIAESNL
jgi:hypothetical protein